VGALVFTLLRVWLNGRIQKKCSRDPKDSHSVLNWSSPDLASKRRLQNNISAASGKPSYTHPCTDKWQPPKFFADACFILERFETCTVSKLQGVTSVSKRRSVSKQLPTGCWCCSAATLLWARSWVFAVPLLPCSGIAPWRAVLGKSPALLSMN
jgi:hypothetical protein